MAWYTLFAHVRNIPNIPWNQDTVVICNFLFRCTAYFCVMAELNDAVPAIWKLVEAINAPTSCSSAQSKLTHGEQLECHDIMQTFT